MAQLSGRTRHINNEANIVCNTAEQVVVKL